MTETSMTWTWQAAMDSPLSAFLGWHFSVHCAPCRVLRQLDVDRLLAARGDHRVIAVVARLRCSRCGAEPAAIVLASGHHGDGRGEPQEVRLYP